MYILFRKIKFIKYKYHGKFLNNNQKIYIFNY